MWPDRGADYGAARPLGAWLLVGRVLGGRGDERIDEPIEIQLRHGVSGRLLRRRLLGTLHRRDVPLRGDFGGLPRPVGVVGEADTDTENGQPRHRYGYDRSALKPAHG